MKERSCLPVHCGMPAPELQVSGTRVCKPTEKNALKPMDE